MLLTREFLSNYNTDPEFGFGDMSRLIFQMKYSRTNPNKETFVDVLIRVIEGLNWISENYLNKSISRQTAESIFDDMYNLRLLPAGRPLANLGTSLVQNRRQGAMLNNCAGISFEQEGIVEASKFIIAMSLLGVGVGANIDFREKRRLFKPTEKKIKNFVVPDSREGWVEAVEVLIESYLKVDSPYVVFDYSQIRPKGALIKGTNSIHTGYKPFEQMLEGIRDSLDREYAITPLLLADISNYIGACVVNGGVRRTALMLASSDENIFKLKEDVNRQHISWTSNNSLIAKLGMDYTNVAKLIAEGKDVGLIWQENVVRYGRMNGDVDRRDMYTVIMNPCGEMPQESGELCNLVEINPNKMLDYKKTLYNAVFMAKILSSMETTFDKTDKIIKRNRRFGISQTGITEYIDKYGSYKYIEDLEKWYDYIQTCDKKVSMFFDIPKSIRTTTVKPSGSISKIMGTTAGIHYATAKHLIRRVQVPKNSSYAKEYKNLGYRVVDSVYSVDTQVIEFPIKYNVKKTIEDVSIVHQMQNAKLLQEHWSDNAVSVTITFKESDVKYIKPTLEKYQYYLKGVSFLPYNTKKYKQLPEQKISQVRYYYEKLLVKFRKLFVKKEKSFVLLDAKPDNFCTNDSCENEMFINE